MTPASALKRDEGRNNASGTRSFVIVADAGTVEMITPGGGPCTNVTSSVSSGSALASGIAWTSSFALCRVRLNRYMQLVCYHTVCIFYTAPLCIRASMRM
jgi:hypothetical protein